MKKNFAKNAVIYARVSSIGNRQNTDRQVEDLTAYAVKNGYSVVNIFTEHVSGAKETKDRQTLSDCLTFIEDQANEVSILLVSELSRLGRNVDDVTKNVIAFKEKHINVYFQKEGFQLFDDNGEVNPFTNIFVAVLGTCAQIERDNIKFRLNSGLAQYRANGGRVGRKEGYQKPKEDYLAQYPELIQKLKERKNHLDNGIRDKDDSVRSIAQHFGVNVSTVQTIRGIFEL